MQRYGLITSGAVALVVESPTQPDGWVALPDGVGPGWRYDGNGFAAPAPAPVARWITHEAFCRRAGVSAMTAMELASIDDPTSGQAARAQAAALRVFLRRIAFAQYIDLEDAELRSAVGQIAAAGIPLDAAAVLDAPVAAVERPL